MPSESEHSYSLDVKECDTVQNPPVNIDKPLAIARRATKCKAEFVVAIDRSTFYEDQEGLHFHGVLSVPRASLNGWIYLPEELHAQDGKTVTLFINHEEIFEENPTKRGTMSVFYNHETFNLEYNALATDPEAIEGVKSGKYKHVSMGAMWAGEDKIRGWLFPYGVEIIEGSLVEHPGIPERRKYIQGSGCRRWVLSDS